MELLTLEKENQMDENGIECEICGHTFRNSDEAGIHIGVVHLEDELLWKLIKFFPAGNLNCNACGEECGSEFEKKEHILLKHPWSTLKENEKKYETINQHPDDQDLHEEVFDETLKELCEPEETLAKIPKKMRRKTSKLKVVTRATAAAKNQFHFCLIFRALDLNGQPIIYSLANEVP